MRLEETYRGVTLNLHYDSFLQSYIGYLEGLPHSVSVQAGTYEELLAAYRDAVDDHFADVLTLAAASAENPAAAGLVANQDEDDPFRNRRFLR